MEIRELTQATITSAEAEELARLKTLVDPRRLRTDPPCSRQLAINEIRPSMATFAFGYFGLFNRDRLVGYAESFGATDAENADLCEFGIWADPHHGRGGERLLFDHLDAIESARGRTRYWGWGDIDHEPTRNFWEGELGYLLGYDERASRCELAGIDPALMQQWIDRATERAGGYHLVRAAAPFDDLIISYLAQALEAMNDAPLDDLSHEPEVFDSARAREVESLHLATRSAYQAVFAIETDTGALAGYTSMRIPEAEPRFSRQGDTVTVDAHRNRGIGRWLKADMWQWLQQEQPDVHFLDTGNAESNRAMLAINEEMGYHDVLHHGVWHKPDTA